MAMEMIRMWHPVIVNLCHRRFCSFGVIGICFCLFASFALAAESEDALEPLELGPPLKLKLAAGADASDGMESRFYSLSADQILVRWYAGDTDWRLNTSLTQSSSLGFEDARLSSLHLQMFLYAPNSGIQSLDTPYLMRYLENMKQAYPESSFAVLNQNQFRAPKGSPAFLDTRYGVIRLEVVPNDPELAVFRVSDYLSLVKGRLFVLRVSGPDDVMGRLDDRMPRILAEFLLQ